MSFLPSLEHRILILVVDLVVAVASLFLIPHNFTFILSLSDESPQDHTYLGTDHSTIAPPLVYNSPSPIASLHVSTLAMLSSTTTATTY